MGRLFASASKLVVVYFSNHEESVQADGSHIRHRCFTDWVAAHHPGWTDFYVFARAGDN